MKPPNMELCVARLSDECRIATFEFLSSIARTELACGRMLATERRRRGIVGCVDRGVDDSGYRWRSEGVLPGRRPSNDDALPDSLASLQLFDGPRSRLIPARHVTAYEINSPSFCDYAQSDFVMKVPPGASIHYMPDGPFEFPVGTVLAQTLSYADADRDGARRIVETRVLLRREDKWIGLPYVWNEEQTDASLELIGARIEIRRRLADGEVRQQTHIVPNFNDCKRCHRIGDIVTPIAAGVRQLNCPPPASGPGEGQLASVARPRTAARASAGRRFASPVLLERSHDRNSRTAGTSVARCELCPLPQSTRNSRQFRLAIGRRG